MAWMNENKNRGENIYLFNASLGYFLVSLHQQTIITTMPLPKPLTIYKASAGSGKTFTLAVEYIKLLIRDPQSYRYILAVTFTNKATEEMKNRILSKLYGIAHGLSDAEDYLTQVKKAFPEKSERLIRLTAGQALQLLVHNYHYFRVETIDSFFQSVLRNLARELGLAANLNVGLNNKEVESQAVDNIIANIQHDEDPLLQWIMAFINEKIQDNKSWNVIAGIKDFGLSIFQEFYKTHQDRMRQLMDDAQFFNTYKMDLLARRAKALRAMASFADRYRILLDEEGLSDKCFYRSSQSASAYFKRLETGAFMDGKGPNSYVAPALSDSSALVSKTASASQAQAIETRVVPLIIEAEKQRVSSLVTVNSIDLTLANINELRLLGRIEQEVNDINEATGNFLLSNTQQLLHKLIDGQDTPFIYEKIGGQVRYIMIDEFQDTSMVQWQNFKVLLDDCIAHDNGSLIVGDVKQSIYRWRNGDWRLLQGLCDNENELVGVKPLEVNYRSQRNIINFNNTFFKVAAKMTTQQILSDLQEQGASNNVKAEALEVEKAYADVCQEVPEKRPLSGQVSVRLLPSEDYGEQMIMQVKSIVEQLLSGGTPPGRIAVLVRKNKHIALLAEWFQQHPITVGGQELMAPMVSDEAFRLDASLAVSTIITAMRVLISPNDTLALANLVKAYRKVCLGNDKLSDTNIFIDAEDLRSQLPADVIDHWEELLSMPIIDLAERLYKDFELSRLDGQSAYMCAFFDQLAKYLQRHVAGVSEFLDEWDANLCGKSIHSDEQNGIRLLTIHKSKGLEFDHVIIPWCDWEVEKNDDTLWVEPQVAPYDDLPIAPLNLSKKKLLGSIYKEDYQSEHIKNLVDNLNVLYVAFTRASRNLFVVGRKNSSQYPSQLLATVLDCMCKPPKDGETRGILDITREDCEDGPTSYDYGTFCPSGIREEEATDNIFEQSEQGISIDIKNYETRAHFVQSYDSDDFIMSDEEREKCANRQTYIDAGNILHMLFASIYTLNDLDTAINQLEFQGVLYDKTMTREELKATLSNRLQSQQVRQWFDPHWKVFNECSILTYDDERQCLVEKRPDRVIYDGQQMIVIDFKTGAERVEHQRQVGEYMTLLKDMGYRNVSGYLWYVLTNHVLPVSGIL